MIQASVPLQLAPREPEELEALIKSINQKVSETPYMSGEIKTSEVSARGILTENNKELDCHESDEYPKEEAQGGLKYDDGKLKIVNNYHRGIELYLSSQSDVTDDEKGYVQLITVLDSIKELLDLGQDHLAAESLVSFVKDVQAHFQCGNRLMVSLTSQVCNYGIQKYAYKNYLAGIHYDRLIQSCGRHLEARLLGQHATDEESHLLHIGHVFSNVFMLLELIEKGAHR